MATTTYGSPYVQSSDLVSAWPTASLSVADRIDDVSFKGNGVNDQTASYTGVLLDAGKTVVMNVATANTFTIPTAATVAYENGTMIRISNKGAGTTTVQPIATVTLNGGNVTLLQYQSATIQLVAANVWNVVATPAPAATASGLTLINTTTYSAVSTISVNNCFTGTYQNYKIIIQSTATGATTPTDLRWRFRVGGTDNANATYNEELWYGTASTGTVSGAWVAGSTSLGLPSGQGEYLGETSLEVFSPQLAQRSIILGIGVAAGSANTHYQTRFQYFNANTQFDGFTLFPSSGNFTGTVRTYGYQNS